MVVKTTPGAPLQTRIEIQDTFDIFFSPNGTYLCLWCKPILLDKESGVWTKNVKIINIRSGNKVILEWSNKHQSGWKPQFTVDERILAKGNNNKEIHFFELPQVGGGPAALLNGGASGILGGSGAAGEPVVNINQPTHKYKLERSFGNFS